jgi:hypothetical protein
MRIMLMLTSSPQKIVASFTLAFWLSMFTATEWAAAQTRPISPQEYIESASPLPGGGTVISRSSPGQGVQTITTIAGLPSVSDRISTIAPSYRPSQSIGGVPIYTGRPVVGGTPLVVNNRIANANPNWNVAYPYPTAVAPTARAWNNTAYRQTNTLGLEHSGNPAARLAQNCPTCVPPANYPPMNFSPTTSAPTTVYQPPIYQQPPPAAYQAPTFDNQVLGQPAQPSYGQPNFQPNPYQQPGTIGTPQYGSQGANWYTPFVTGSGAYTPLVKFQNMPPGTYLGQGVIGQPTAYVDGQPVRNLLRYISP